MLGEVLRSVRPRPLDGTARWVGLARTGGHHHPGLGQGELRRLDPADIDAGEKLLTDVAETFGTKDLKRLADQTADAINPDGTVPDDALNADRRHLTMKQCRDGMYAGEFRLTGCVGAKLAALLQPLARPRIDKLTVPDGASLGSVDERTFRQRSHDALEEICDRVLRAGNEVGTGGAPATVIVTVTLEDLMDKLGYATTSDGTLVSTKELLLLANEAEIRSGDEPCGDAAQPGPLGSHRGQHSDPCVDRARPRLFVSWVRSPPRVVRTAPHRGVGRWWLHRRRQLDPALSLPPPQLAGGGWTCRMNADELPEWIPPRWVDRSQRPLVNSRVLAHLPSWRQRRRRRADPRGSPASQPAQPVGVDC